MKLPWNRPLALPPQLEWKYANEPELMRWTIKARNYNTTIANMVSVLFFYGSYRSRHIWWVDW
ncbi:Uncharacterised protein [Pseudomonas aeruginosa]|nr:Uncharacterised protein [Pseudomonas aeruginosa]